MTNYLIDHIDCHVDSIEDTLPLVTLLLVVKATHKSFALTFNKDATKKKQSGCVFCLNGMYSG